jgi:trimeric autotransporter adhesin
MRASMRRAKMLAFAAAVGVAGSAFAAPVLTDNFDSYSTGNLVGQDSWTITGTIATNPIQVVSPGVGGSGNQASMITSGQDAFKPFTSPVPHNDGSTIYTGLDVTVTAAQATGDYFVHLSDPAGTTTNFYQRLFAKASTVGGDFQLGIAETSGGSPAVDYGATGLTFNTVNHVVVAWNFVPGTTNDTFKIYVNPTSNSEGLNPVYLSRTWSSATAEPAQLSAFNFRQGTAANSATELVDNISVSDTFSDTAGVPEPASASLLLLGGVSLLRRRRKIG